MIDLADVKCEWNKKLRCYSLDAFNNTSCSMSVFDSAVWARDVIPRLHKCPIPSGENKTLDLEHQLYIVAWKIKYRVHSNFQQNCPASSATSQKKETKHNACESNSFPSALC